MIITLELGISHYSDWTRLLVSVIYSKKNLINNNTQPWIVMITIAIAKKAIPS